MTTSIADHDRSHAGTVSAIAIAKPVTVTVPVEVAVAITFPEHAPIVIIALEEAARAADAEVVADLATHARDLLGDAELVLRRP